MFLRKFFILVSILALVLFSAGCDDEDNPVENHEHHFDAEGIFFESSGIVLAEIFQGSTTDTLYAEAGELSSHIEVMFYDKDKNELEPPTDEDKSFSWEIADTNIVTLWQHEGEEGSFEFHLNGKTAGTTTAEFFILHGSHSDFRSGEITIKVQ